jgi:hypothetical protein
VLCVLLSGSPLRATEIFVSPQLETAVGFDSNRYQTEGGEGASLASIMPSLDLTCFLTETMEGSAVGAYSRREFLREGFSHQISASGSMGLWHTEASWEGGASAGVVRNQDAAIPEDDMTRVGGSLGCALIDLSGRRYALSGSIERITYDSAETDDGNAVTGTSWRLRPELRIPAKHGLSVWGAPLLEGFLSNDPSRKYTGYGLGLGLDYVPPLPFRAGVSLQAGTRSYPTAADGGSPEEDSSALSLGLWGALRLGPRTELFSDLQGGTFWSDDVLSDYRRWQWRAGIRLRHDAEIGRQAP